MSSYLLPVVSNSCEISIFPCRGFVTLLRKQIARYQKHQTTINGQQNVAIKIPQRHSRLVRMVGSIYRGWILQHFVPSSVAPLNKGYHNRVRNKIPKFSDSPFICTGWYKKLKHRVWITSKTACLSRHNHAPATYAQVRVCSSNITYNSYTIFNLIIGSSNSWFVIVNENFLSVFTA